MKTKEEKTKSYVAKQLEVVNGNLKEERQKYVALRNLLDLERKAAREEIAELRETNKMLMEQNKSGACLSCGKEIINPICHACEEKNKTT